ncbi:hypothetical protein GF312_13400 [Candidatus Poribacteria bacterium]|nr:hypothetical protein [Candidatus Poribacteria bacterium]
MKFFCDITVFALTICVSMPLLCPDVSGDTGGEKSWWDKPKIAMVYGGVGGKGNPIDAYELLRISGISAIVGGVASDDETIEYAAEKGINLIGLGYAWGIPHSIPSSRSAMNEKGQITTAACPFSRPFWEGTIRQPVLNTLEKSLEHPNVVGFFVDSEQYAVYPRIRTCFCYDCWETFLKDENLQDPGVDETQRAIWLAENGYLKGRDSEDPEEWKKAPKAPFFGKYIEWVKERLTEQYKSLADEVHAKNPEFVFGKLPGNPTYWYSVGMARGTATDEAPFFLLLESTYASAPGYGSKPERGGWIPGFTHDREDMEKLDIPFRIIGGAWLTVDTVEKADKRYTRDVFQLYDQGHRLGSHPDSDGYWFGPVSQITSRKYFREHYPGCNIRDYWLAVRNINRYLGIEVPDDEGEVLNFLRKIDD